MAGGSRGDAGGAEVEDEDAVVVDLGVEELESFGDRDAAVLEQAVCADDLAAAWALRPGWVGIFTGEGRWFKANAVIYRVEKQLVGFRRAESVVGEAAQDDPAFGVDGHIKCGPLAAGRVAGYFFPHGFHSCFSPVEKHRTETGREMKCHYSQIDMLCTK